MKEFKTILNKLEKAPQIPAVKLAKRAVLTAEELVAKASAELKALPKEEVKEAKKEAPKKEAPAPEAPKKEVKPSEDDNNEIKA